MADVPHLPRSGISWRSIPALTGWANFCRASGASFLWLQIDFAKSCGGGPAQKDGPYKTCGASETEMARWRMC